ncbi:MAG: OmcA/MtrC family decaheme c-type cytochrome [Desulfobacterales bacterium]
MYKRLSYAIAGTLASLVALALLGCSGGNSTAGDVDGGEEAARIAAVQVTDNGSTATMTVNFELSDDGTPLAGTDGGDIRFTVAKLITASSPNSWQSYINRTETKEAGDPGTTPDGTTAYQANSEFADTDGGVFTDNGDGTYSYTFSFNFRAVTDPVAVTYDPALTHRVAMQVSDNVTNASYDFVPGNPNAEPATRSIVSNASCSECHERLALHGGDRVSVEYCVTCHNPGTSDANSGNTVDFTVMVHKIHDAADYTIWGFNNSEHDYSDVLYPQEIVDCRKCHNGDDPATPDGDDWKTVPSEAACSSCHPAPANVLSFTPDQIEAAHLTANSTPNNPFLPPGVPNMVYVLNSATVDGSNQAVIRFEILRDGAPLDLLNLPADLTAANNRPSFIFAYALPQDGITNPAEYNNLGQSAAQPVSVSLGDLSPIAGDPADVAGTLVANGDGTFTATTGGAVFPTGIFPPGATRRAVGLQGYFQVDTDGDGTADYPLHTPSAVVAVSGDAERREVVDNNKCASCHEWFEGHGGNRVFNMNICVFCHNPNLSSSGRTVDPATASAEVVAAYGPDPLTYPEATNNFKDMVHGIHGAEVRSTDYEFVRNRNNGIPYNWSEVVFPQSAGNCLACHISNSSFTPPLDEDTLLTTNRTTGESNGMDLDTAAVQDARDTVPNPTDFVITPTAAACYACHDGEVVQAHMEGNGAFINANRSDASAALETCALCHGSGKSADVAVAHRTVEPTVLGVIKAPPEEDGGDSGGGGQTQVDLCGPGPISSQPGGHTARLDCCSCHGFN